MNLIFLIFVLLVFGLFLWAINKYVPMQKWIKMLLNFVVVAVLIYWILKSFGLLSALNVSV